jgi:hypothetical protein
MEPHAGFAAVISIGEDTMQDLLRVLYAANRIDHFIEVDNRFPGGAGGVSGRLTVELPRLRLAAENADRLHLDLRCWGSLRIKLGDAPAARRDVLFRAPILVPPQVRVGSSGIRFGVDGAAAQVPSLERTVLGRPYPEAIQALFDSDLFRTEFESTIQDQLAAQRAAPLTATFLGGLAGSSGKTVTAHVLDGAVLIAVDVDAEVAGRRVRTSGDASQLADFRGENDVAFTLNPRVAPLVFSAVRREVAAKARQQNATLEDFDLAYRGDHLHVSGTAARSPGTVDFSFDLFPHLEQHLSFRPTNVTVNVNVPWWVRLGQAILGVVSFGVAALSIEAYVDMIRGNVVRGIEGPGRSVGRRWRSFTLTGTRRPRISQTLEFYEFRREGVLSGISLRPILQRTTMLNVLARAYRNTDTHVQVFGSVRLPVDFARDDPQLRARWTVRRLDTNTAIEHVDAPIAEARTHRASLTVADAPPEAGFNVECRVYRTLGAETEEVLNESHPFETEPPPDPARRYLRWRLDTITPSVRVEEDGSLTRLGRRKVTRFSRIHRLDLPSRCLFATEGGPHISGRIPVFPTYEVEFLSELPFPRSQLTRHRNELCDYCFFGGPTKTEPIA